MFAAILSFIMIVGGGVLLEAYITTNNIWFAVGAGICAFILVTYWAARVGLLGALLEGIGEGLS